MSNKRNVILVGDELARGHKVKPGTGAIRDGNRILATQSGLLQEGRGRIGVIPFTGRYEPKAGDLVIGKILDANTGNWILDIGAPYDAPLHVSECPWRVDFGETHNYLAPGDSVLCKVLFVDQQRKVQVTMKDRNLMKLEDGELLDVGPTKVARVIGRSGSMINLIKGYLECWLFVGQNGRIWVQGEPDEVLAVKDIIHLIDTEAHLPGLTDKVRARLEAVRPGGVDNSWESEEEE